MFFQSRTGAGATTLTVNSKGNENVALHQYRLFVVGTRMMKSLQRWARRPSESRSRHSVKINAQSGSNDSLIQQLVAVRIVAVMCFSSGVCGS